MYSVFDGDECNGEKLNWKRGRGIREWGVYSLKLGHQFLTEKVTFTFRDLKEVKEGARWVFVRREFSRGISQYKSPEPGLCLMCWRKYGWSRVSLDDSLEFKGREKAEVWGVTHLQWGEDWSNQGTLPGSGNPAVFCFSLFGCAM